MHTHTHTRLCNLLGDAKWKLLDLEKNNNQSCVHVYLCLCACVHAFHSLGSKCLTKKTKHRKNTCIFSHYGWITNRIFHCSLQFLDGCDAIANTHFNQYAYHGYKCPVYCTVTDFLICRGWTNSSISCFTSVNMIHWDQARNKTSGPKMIPDSDKITGRAMRWTNRRQINYP